MPLYNPYRNYDKGMEDAYMGYEPQNTRSREYMIGYEYAEYLLSSEQEAQECDASKADQGTEVGNQNIK